ncbi:hypothetical protein [Leptolyngbya ohadii]|uniref:hypothetical protein n=1 Tax=Leptolyngbya ohadii TaxID=1962290 RepID=UPI000B59D342|nr:hypothetical protein [Leptolyngbya ohadii]
MSYYNQLNPWCVVRCLPNAQTLIVARLRRRPDAEAHLRILQQLSPSATYRLLFDLPEHQPVLEKAIDSQPSGLSGLTFSQPQQNP